MSRRASDHEEFLEATLCHAGMLHALAARLAPHPADAADLVQDTYLRAYAAWHGRRPRDVGAWLATICLNAGRDELRRHSRRLAASYHGPFPDLADRADTAEAALERLGSSRIEAALRALPDAQRVAITLMDICGFTGFATTSGPRSPVPPRLGDPRPVSASASRLASWRRP